MADVPLVNNPMTAVADSIIGGTVTGGVAAPTRLKNNWSAAVAPTVNEDSGDGYAIGSRWIDTTADKEYVALDVTVGAAVWTETTAGSGGSVATDAIWDAAGDLAVGTGSNTASRLALGAAGGALSRVNGAVAWNSGTAFPTAATGDRYWRTDLGLEFYYDGTRWLTVELFRSETTTGLIAASTSLARFALFNPTYDMWLVETRVSYYVNGTNNGTSYWKFHVLNDGGTDILNTTSNSSTGSGSTWTQVTQAQGNAITAVKELEFYFEKISAPGNVQGGMMLTYRLIGV
jgi:hypothetical protein